MDQDEQEFVAIVGTEIPLPKEKQEALKLLLQDPEGLDRIVLVTVGHLLYRMEKDCGVAVGIGVQNWLAAALKKQVVYGDVTDFRSLNRAYERLLVGLKLSLEEGDDLQGDEPVSQPDECR